MRRRTPASARPSTARRGRSARRSRSCVMPSACTAAPEVSPPATTSRRTPRSTRPRRDARPARAPPARRRARRRARPARAARRPARPWRRPAPGHRALARRTRRALRVTASSPAASASGSTCSAGRPLSQKCAHLRIGGDRAAARHHRARGPRRPAVTARWHRCSVPRSRTSSAAGRSRRPSRRSPARRSFSADAKLHQVGVGDGVDAPRCVTPSARSASKRFAIAAGALRDPRRASISPTLRRCLRLQHAHQVGVGHRRQRVVVHAAVAQQHVADEQVALEHRALVVREGRAGDREALACRAARPSAHRSPGRCCPAAWCRRSSST